MRWGIGKRQGGAVGRDLIAAVPTLRHEWRPPCRPRDTLVINLSYDDAPTLRHVDFGASTIDVADAANSYFLTSVEPLLAAVDALADAGALRRVCFFGLSKAGFAALMLSRLLAQRLPDLRVGAVALGPMTRLWPPDPRIAFPSYRQLLARAETDEALAAALRDHGDQTQPASLANLRWIVGYGVRSRRDSRAALALGGASLTLVPVPLTSHGVLIPFLCQGEPEHRVRRIVAAAARNGAIDGDLASDALSADGELMLAEIAAMVPRPTIAELVRVSVSPRSVLAQVGFGMPKG